MQESATTSKSLQQQLHNKVPCQSNSANTPKHVHQLVLYHSREEVEDEECKSVFVGLR